MPFFIFVPVWVLLLGASGIDADKVSFFVMVGDSVTLHSDVKTHQQEKIKWYFNDTRIAQISDYLSKTCTDVQCNEGTERFRDRLKVDDQTGSLTIINTRNTDSGVYKLQIISSSSMSEKLFSVTVHAKIARDSSEICSGDECEDADGRFRDRLKLDQQTGSLTITNTRTTDSGDYHLEIITNSSSICRQYSIRIISEKSLSGTGSNGIVFLLAIAGLCVGVLLVVAGVSGECRRKLACVKSFFYPSTNQTAVL